MYPYPAPVPRLYRALALIQALIAILTLLGLVIYWMTSTGDAGSSTRLGADTYDLGLYAVTLLAPVAVMLVGLLVSFVGLAVFLAKGSLPARVASCCGWAVLLIAGLVLVQVHPAFVLVLFVSLCMLLALALADRLAAGRSGPAAVPAAPPAPFQTGQIPVLPPAPGTTDTGSFPQHPNGPQ
ncbi:Integral membrane protein OS=Tsukamurella paurometabola (strain ATCC 8368 / DSM / CCUG 35730/ CIP 100753 / JCM 10117 / KCTC 9821 / NBRC 16120 / NCIMB 702349/ NCTC 13040) OX=521096 GN=Tpau_4017 PE=4 SV=1 [Tsukamurella paurometabola]|uniref:Uncharacterized protein n=1 Tax=Tsukamurella paurometabola (strain ATCC 8368 / DSM 20162 / CCUG 35730 / CIP 100753 / JCM 10117 / KCTC 9821 / NBRC 16120 / NCIMB 702349 / NCTC 13040) TaxID=521096 RepID=D5UN93_TSUPD|nr:hypothetical protein [Tsukamurella paurometabola]ADG80588.1 hypothetical protein Tpau_4017 [Tsukamurella paurometabola DSM 20162]SUP40194.1 Uncharacterised protein [Tsukamurella paurometabola]